MSSSIRITNIDSLPVGLQRIAKEINEGKYESKVSNYSNSNTKFVSGTFTSSTSSEKPFYCINNQNSYFLAN